MKLSVALCTYNGEKYLRKQLDSILNQTVSVHQIVVCDDQSSDSTVAILKEYETKNPSIFEIHVNKNNLRSNKNFEKAIGLCTGDYIFLSDQDDIWKPNKFETILKEFDKNQSAEAIFSNADLINDFDQNYTHYSLWDNVLFLEKELPKPIDLLLHIMQKSNYLTGCTCCIKQQALKHILPFPELGLLFHDEWIALVFSTRKTLYYSTEKLINYRIHSGQQIGAIKTEKVERSTKIAKIIFGLEKTSNFKLLFKIYKNYFRNYNKFNILKNNNSSDCLKIINCNELIQFNLKKIKETKQKLLKSNFILYFSNYLVDKIRNKRQIS